MLALLAVGLNLVTVGAAVGVVIVVLTLVLAACSEPKKQVDISEAIPNLPLPPAPFSLLRGVHTRQH